MFYIHAMDNELMLSLVLEAQSASLHFILKFRQMSRNTRDLVTDHMLINAVQHALPYVKDWTECQEDVSRFLTVARGYFMPVDEPGNFKISLWIQNYVLRRPMPTTYEDVLRRCAVLEVI